MSIVFLYMCAMIRMPQTSEENYGIWTKPPIRRTSHTALGRVVTLSQRFRRAIFGLWVLAFAVAVVN